VSLLAPWLLFPSVVAALALGCGLALERAGGARLPGPLLAPSGLAVIIVVASFFTIAGATARLAVPAVVTVAAAGLACGLGRKPSRGALIPLAVALVVFAAYAAPVVLSGQATFAGYIKLDDTATFLALTDRVMQHGHSLAGLAPSSYEATLSINLGHGYPIGGLLPFGTGGALVGVDGAWLYQPYLAFLAAMLALVLYELAGRVVASRRLQGLAAVVAAQPALLYGFALWGGIKELAAAPLVALLAALTSPLRLLPLAAAVAALLSVLSIGGVVWLLVPAAALAVLVLRRLGTALEAVVLCCAVLLLSVPTLVDSRSFLNPATETAVRSGTELGNLVRPLSGLQVFGVWPTGDFRLEPSDLAATRILLATVAAAALLGLAFAWRAGATGVLLYAGSAVVGCALVAGLASPWIVAKAYAIAGPALLLAALVGCAALVTRGRVAEGVVGLVAVVGGVLWSNVLAYHEVNLAPRQQLVELERIGHRFARNGPTLMTEYQPYGVRHFLRALDPEGASELRRRLIPLRNGSLLDKGAYADLADLQRSAVLVYRTLVLRGSPVASRPPDMYRLVWRGSFYEVWQRPDALDPTRALAGVRQTKPAVVLVSLPLRTSVRLSHGGCHSIWIGGSFRNRLTAEVDGHPVGSRTAQLDNAGQYTLIGSVALARGRHLIELRDQRRTLAPGSGGSEYGLGPVVVTRVPDASCS
jgi:hypothetical protein